MSYLEVGVFEGLDGGLPCPMEGSRALPGRREREEGGRRRRMEEEKEGQALGALLVEYWLYNCSYTPLTDTRVLQINRDVYMTEFKVCQHEGAISFKA